MSHIGHDTVHVGREYVTTKAVLRLIKVITQERDQGLFFEWGRLHRWMKPTSEEQLLMFEWAGV